eukprot:1186163-Amorphochlora_amoeboformis.AAC.2
MGFPRPLNPVIPTVGISIDLTQCLSISKRHHPPSFPMPLAKDISNYLGYSAVLLALWSTKGCREERITNKLEEGLGTCSSSQSRKDMCARHMVAWTGTCKYDGDPELCVLPSFKDDQGFA